MADNVNLASPSGTAAADDVGGVLYQYVKLTWGVDDTINKVTNATGKGLPVTLYEGVLPDTAGGALAAIKTAIEGTLAISGTITANAGTNLNTSALALETGGNLASAATHLATLAGSIGTSGPTAPTAAVSTVAAYSTVLGKNSSAITGSTETDIVAASASNYHTIEQIILTNAGTQGTLVTIDIDEGTSTEIIVPLPAPNSSETNDVSGVILNLGRLRQGAVNKKITAQCSNSGNISVIVTVIGSTGTA